MKFFIDANHPFKLASNLKRKGFDVIHTDNCSKKEKTTDREIRKIATEQKRIVISKDSDFLDSHLIQGVPQKLLLIGTGNIKNQELFKLIENNFEEIIKLFESIDLIELTNDQIIVHEKYE